MRYADSNCSIISLGSEYLVQGKDVFTGTEVEVRIPSTALWEYRNGQSIQDCMHMLSPSEREFLMSGIWDDDGFFDEEAE